MERSLTLTSPDFMPDKRTHRGAHPLDARLFAPDQIPVLRAAVGDLCEFLERGYAPKSTLQLVGNRFALHERQRLAVLRSACSEGARRERLQHQIGAPEIGGRTVHLDGYNVLMIAEAALGGAVILRGRDEGFRDMASMHGNFRRVEETAPAASFIGQFLADLRPERVVWWLDSSVSNSGRLATLLRELAARNGWNWDVELVLDADAVLKREVEGVVASADSAILDAGVWWFNLGRELIEREVANAWIVDLGLNESARPESG